MVVMHHFLSLPLALSVWATKLNPFPKNHTAAVVPQTEQATFVLQDIRNELRTQLPKRWRVDTPFLSTDDIVPYAPECLSNRLIFTRERITVDLVVNEDKAEVIAGSSYIAANSTASNSRTDPSLSGWTFSKGTALEASALIGGIFKAMDISPTFPGPHSGTNDDKPRHKHTRSVSTAFWCPAYHACSVQTWTYLVTIQGQCSVIPIYHPNCVNEAVRRASLSWGTTVKAPIHEIMRKKQPVALAALRGNIHSWDRAGTLYYSISRKDGSPVGLTTPLYAHDGVWHPSREHDVRYRFDAPCNYTALVKTRNGHVMSNQVIVERDLTRNKEGDGGGPSASDAKDRARRVKVIFLERGERVYFWLQVKMMAAFSGGKKSS